MQTIPLPQTTITYPEEAGITSGLLPFTYPSPNLLLSPFNWSADMSFSELTPHPQYYKPHPDFINTLDHLFPFDPYLSLYPFP